MVNNRIVIEIYLYYNVLILENKKEKYYMDEKDNGAVNIIFVLFIIAILVYAMVMGILYINTFLHSDMRNQVESAGLEKIDMENIESESIIDKEYKFSLKNGEAIVLGLSEIESDLIKDNKLIIPETIIYDNKTYRVTEIGSEAFMGKNLKTVNIPSSVRSIGQSAFRENNISDLDLGSSVEIISKNAFADNSLDKIKIPDSVKKIESGSFKGNKIMEVDMAAHVQLDDWAINGRFADAYFFALEGKGRYIREDEYLYSWKIK